MEIDFLIETKKKRSASKAHVMTIEVKLSKNGIASGNRLRVH